MFGMFLGSEGFQDIRGQVLSVEILQYISTCQGKCRGKEMACPELIIHMPVILENGPGKPECCRDRNRNCSLN
jgi:hypothetical protein